ncbi:hypothetical protein [Anaerostipes sp. Marseille-Q3525]|jgi:hypothetical protein|uniref:hypothetical protein n=1 Tax=Anaerostipes sp. Marseille-Q3525 TaxID=2758418 RepID=UPI001BA4C55C|nr:hypothetical protein [Anaerostipes sp. Marseille-Q3525]MBR9960801.1 hypothetical protein [Anaerostipes sp. Marseille-Q3525]
MDKYIAQKDNIRFYIQPDMIEEYVNFGYTIIKVQEVVLTEKQISKAIEQASADMTQQKVEVINAG